MRVFLKKKVKKFVKGDVCIKEDFTMLCVKDVSSRVSAVAVLGTAFV